MNKRLRNAQSIGCMLGVLIIASYPNLTIAQSGTITEDLTATSTTIFATTSTGESLPVPANNEPAIEDDKELTQEVTSTNERPLTASQQDRIINLAANISNRLDMALTRLQNIHTRMESRAELLTSSGQDTTSATDTLTQSKALLTQIKTRLETIDSKVYSATTAPTPRTAWVLVRNEYVAIATDLRSSKELQTRALAELKTTTPIQLPPESASSTDLLTP